MHTTAASMPKKNRQRRAGSIIVLSALFMVVLLGFCAFAIDLGYIANTQTELRRAVDAGALAGAGVLVDGSAATIPVARQFVQSNLVGARAAKDSEITIQTGFWNNGAFSVSDNRPSAIRVVAQRPNQPLFFGRIFGKNTFSLTAEAIAQYQPRDIMLTLDFSGSMNDDSTYAARNSLGKSYIDANLQQIWQEMGSPKYGNMNFTPVTNSNSNTNTVIKNLKLDKVPYPYPGGSWSEYVSHVRNNGDLNGANYRNKYGMLTFIHYLLVDRDMFSESPILVNVSAQPVTALKDATEVFLSFLKADDTDDRLGLSIYNSSNETAVLESGLTNDYNAVNLKIQGRQAGHYNSYTNIGAGMKTSRLELQNKGRIGAFRLMILMTDGIANRPTNESTAKALVLSEANLCAGAKIPVVTISLGAGADKALMQSVADITGGVHFNIPGGQTASQYEAQLTEVFSQIASTRPLKLVK